jgi:hypothetical protein
MSTNHSYRPIDIDSFDAHAAILARVGREAAGDVEFATLLD